MSWGIWTGFVSLICINIAHIYKAKISYLRNANKFGALTSVWLGFCDVIMPGCIFWDHHPLGCWKKTLSFLGISVVPCWKWLASWKLSKESLRWEMTFLFAGKIVSNPTSIKNLGWFQSKIRNFDEKRESVWCWIGRLYWNHFLEKPQLRLLFRRIQWIPVSWKKSLPALPSYPNPFKTSLPFCHIHPDPLRK